LLFNRLTARHSSFLTPRRRPRRVPADHARSAAVVLLALPPAQPYLALLLPTPLEPTDPLSSDPLSASLGEAPPPAWADALAACRALDLPHLAQVPCNRPPPQQ
jgi:hypothetical protein